MLNEWEKDYKKIKEKIEDIELIIMKIELDLTYNKALMKRLKKKELDLLKSYRFKR